MVEDLINNIRCIPFEGQRKLAIHNIKNLGNYYPRWDVACHFRADEKSTISN